MSENKQVLDHALPMQALSIYKPPFKFENGYFTDADGNMVADKHEALRLRGWGRISYMPTPEELQDCIGDLIAQAMTEFWSRRAVLSASAGEKKAMERLEKFLDAAGGIGFVLAGVDAGDLYAELFPEQSASKSNQEQSTNKEGE